MRVNINTAAFVIACILAMIVSLAYLAYGGDFVPDDYTACMGSAGIEVLRENNKVLSRHRKFIYTLAHKIALVLIASGVGWILWLIIEGIRASIRGRYL
jgi:hypothetical protein